MDVYFSDYFKVEENIIEEYGAFNISLITDLPLFIDPFLLFNSNRKEYEILHKEILTYLRFLKDKSLEKTISNGLLKSWYQFPEIKQNWFGFCKTGNGGSGLGRDFAMALNDNLKTIFSTFGTEEITRSSHLEKLCLIKTRVGKDNISDFTTNLIHGFLLNYTEKFAQTFIKPEFRKKLNVRQVRFNYRTETWETGLYDLPWYNGDYVLLTPLDILTKDDTWINKTDLTKNFDAIPTAIPNDALRAEINNYFLSILPEDPDKESKDKAKIKTVIKYPILIDYFIKYKEDNGDGAVETSFDKVETSKALYVRQSKELINTLEQQTEFYINPGNTYEESMARVLFLKDVIENKDGYRLFYVKGKPVKKEDDLQILFRLTWFATSSDVNREVNNGRGPVDYKISRGNIDKTLVEFKLASNSQLKKNLANQVEIYEKANNTNSSIKVIMFFSDSEETKVKTILKELKLDTSESVIMIDARNGNKPSASKADKKSLELIPH